MRQLIEMVPLIDVLRTRRPRAIYCDMTVFLFVNRFGFHMIHLDRSWWIWGTFLPDQSDFKNASISTISDSSLSSCCFPDSLLDFKGQFEVTKHFCVDTVYFAPSIWLLDDTRRHFVYNIFLWRMSWCCFSSELNIACICHFSRVHRITIVTTSLPCSFWEVIQERVSRVGLPNAMVSIPYLMQSFSRFSLRPSNLIPENDLTL